jgi:hypothetical protein
MDAGASQGRTRQVVSRLRDFLSGNSPPEPRCAVSQQDCGPGTPSHGPGEHFLGGPGPGGTTARAPDSRYLRQLPFAPTRLLPKSPRPQPLPRA